MPSFTSINPLGESVEYSELGTDILKYKLLETLDLTNAAQRKTSDLSAYRNIILLFKDATAQHTLVNANATANTYKYNYLISSGSISNLTGQASFGAGLSNGYYFIQNNSASMQIFCVGVNQNVNSLLNGFATGSVTTITTNSTVGTCEVYVKW